VKKGPKLCYFRCGPKYRTLGVGCMLGGT